MAPVVRDSGRKAGDDLPVHVRDELRISPVPALAVLSFSPLVAYAVAVLGSWPRPTKGPVISYVLLLLATPFAGWLIYHWRQLAGRWFTVLAFGPLPPRREEKRDLLAIVLFVGYWLSSALSVPSAVQARVKSV